MNVTELISKYFADFLANPLPTALALLIGAYAGFLMSRMRHQGRIETLEERVKHRDDQIELKDRTIQTMSSNAVARAEKVTEMQEVVPTAPPVQSAISAPKSPERFRVINQQIDQDTEAAIRRAISGTRFKFVFNPKSGSSKVLTFLDDGSIGEGRNSNESRWKIKNGLLEILHADGGLYSRFTFVPDKSSFHHTNETVTRSIKGQYLTPLD